MSAVEEWLSEAMSRPWWNLSDGCLRVALVVRRLAGSSDVAITNLEDVAVMAAIPRSTTRRCLLRLEEAGFCAITSVVGRAGRSEIRLLSAHDGEGRLQPSISPRKPPDPGPVEEVYEETNREHLETNTPAELFSLARDQDLLRSPDPDPLPDSDLRSSTSRDLSRSEVSARNIDGTGRFARTNVKAAQIPERAWKAADYLREQLLLAQPGAAIGKPGIRWAPNIWTGRRFQWANEFRLLVDVDRRSWDEVAKTVHWLFHRQSVEARFIVQSPDALRRKWDRIQAVRTTQAGRSVSRGADGRPDPLAERTYKRLTPGDM